MNKNILKLFLILFCIIVSINKVNAAYIKHNNKGHYYRIIVEDDANLLSDDEISKLREKMMPLTRFGHVAFKTINHKLISTSNYASDYYHKVFGTDSGSLFLIDMHNRYIYIFSDGNNYKTITSAKANIITDNVYKYASKSQYYECAAKAFEQMNSLLRGEKIKEPMRYICNIFISFAIAFFINFIIVLYNTKSKKTKVEEILGNCNIKFEVKNIEAIKVGKHKEYSPSSSDSSSSFSSGSSSSSSSGGSSGGFSSGGGGGHRF